MNNFSGLHDIRSLDSTIHTTQLTSSTAVLLGPHTSTLIFLLKAIAVLAVLVLAAKEEEEGMAEAGLRREAPAITCGSE